ncbi:Alpha/Beta hydrolase protein [Dendryphion nanum]|uniref:Alpha/Beta hydrolase protein n=1 Tax=Dendryphion nanum TaxID=256645 RepID=A0A9P9D5Y7_9PLEO|nr:Alpha/Beta hydrolase protein [Dendryphion nanum]
MAHLTRDEVLESGIVNPEYQKVFDSRPDNISGNTFFEIRDSRAAHLARLRHLYPIPGPIPSQVTETMHTIPTRDGHSINVRVYQPVSGPPPDGSPLILMYHEGGWSMGDLTDEDQNCRLFARDLGAVCVNVEYRLAPEHPFPTGINDSWDALKWAVDRASDLKASPTRGLIVGGSSAGGNIAAVLALIARDENFQPPITGQYLCVPALLPPENVPQKYTHLYESRTQSLSDPILKDTVANQDSGMNAIIALYNPDPKSPLWDPFNHSDGHGGLARAFFQVAGLDPLRDEAVLYDGVLREGGVLTRFELYKGLGHMFWTNWPEMEASTGFMRDTVRGMRWLLGE